MKNERGFTLIEVLVVAGIIAIASSILYTSLSSSRERSADAKVKAQLSGFRSAAEIYYDTSKGYSNGSGGRAGVCPDLSGGNDVFDDLVGYTYITPPNLPPGVTTSCYHDGGVGGRASKYMITSTLRSDPFKAFCVDSAGNAKELSATEYAARDTNGEVVAAGIDYKCQ